jgi:hypothetical protein
MVHNPRETAQGQKARKSPLMVSEPAWTLRRGKWRRQVEMQADIDAMLARESRRSFRVLHK